ncbi:MAG: transglutaminase-like domain-containing protein [Clostridiales Family XIII bacterium]|jgi:transglutaminase-like putative cysteine protease|nr:transglutaminase-like domain-containing protein [Clostridiales Family XIII bacterium]
MNTRCRVGKGYASSVQIYICIALVVIAVIIALSAPALGFTDTIIPQARKSVQHRVQGIINPILNDADFEVKSWENPETKELITAKVSYKYQDKGLIYIDIAVKDPTDILILLVNNSDMDKYTKESSYKKYLNPGFYPMDVPGGYLLKISTRQERISETASKFHILYRKNFEAKFEGTSPASYANVYTSYDENSALAADAIDATNDIVGDREKVAALIQHMQETFSYDWDMLSKKKDGAIVESDMLGDVDAYYAKKTGLCFQITQVFSSMCKAIGIPCREVRGYNNTHLYHSWAQVYVDGKWLDVDPGSADPFEHIAAEGFIRTSVAY